MLTSAFESRLHWTFATKTLQLYFFLVIPPNSEPSPCSASDVLTNKLKVFHKLTLANIATTVILASIPQIPFEIFQNGHVCRIFPKPRIRKPSPLSPITTLLIYTPES